LKRRDLISHLVTHGCVLERQGAKHEWWANPSTGRSASVPRHREINDFTARAICRQLGILEPG
jgi:hypothetical protein